MEFSTPSVSIYEGEKKAKVGVRRSGAMGERVSVRSGITENLSVQISFLDLK